MTSQHSLSYNVKGMSTLAKTGASVLESVVKPFHTGQRDIIPSSSHKYGTATIKYPRIVHANYNPSELINRLTLKRLRKMQALVRGFLVRRVTYPRLMKRYRLCKMIYEMVCKDCLLAESSSIVLDILASNKQNKDFCMESMDQRISTSVSNLFIANVMQEMSKEIIATCISKQIQKRNPVIKLLTAGTTVNHYRLDIPEERLVHQLIDEYIDGMKERFARQIIQQTVDEMRLQKLAEDYIMKQVIVKLFASQIVNQYVREIYIEQIGERVINNAMEDFARVLVRYELKKAEEQREPKVVERMKDHLLEQLIAEQILQMMIGEANP